MTTSPHTATAEVTQDLSPEWLELVGRIRLLAREVEEDPAADPRALAREAVLLCGHVERLHADVERLLGGLTPPPTEGSRDEPPARLDSEDQEKLKIQREIHEDNVNVRDVIKALFLWRDTSADRLREREEEERDQGSR